MPDVTCTACGRPVPDMAYLCTPCTTELRTATTSLRDFADDLELTVTRQARIGAVAAAVHRDDENPLPFNAHASEVAWVVLNTTTAWARLIVTTRGHPLPRGTIRATADVLVRSVDWLRHRPDAPTALEELAPLARMVVRTIDRPPSTTFAGRCTHDDTALYSRLHAATVTCPTCGAAYDVADQQTLMLDLAEDQLAYAAEMAAALSNLGRAARAGTIREWARRGRLAAHGHDRANRPLYRVGDVLDLLAADPDRKATA